MELSTDPDFEYICLIDVRSKRYSVFSRTGDNSHDIPEFADFDEVTRQIRDTQVPPKDRNAYYEKASLDRVFAEMDAADGSYSYRDTLMDGVTREAVFNWYEESRFELLMTVRKIPE